MGRQIRFFMTDFDETIFLKFIKESNHLILDRWGNVIDFESVSTCKEMQVLIALKDSNLCTNESGFIKDIKSDVIEYTRCMKKDDNKLCDGRLWVELKYYDEQGVLVEKGAKIKEAYNKYKKWIVKCMRISIDKDYYIADGAYKLYKDGRWTMSTGPLSNEEF